jgi:DNA-binding XRE family transcriptional regulator
MYKAHISVMAQSWNRFMKQMEAKAKATGPVHAATLEALQAHYSRLGQELANERKRLDISQASLAKATGIDQAEISRIEHDQVDPRMGTYVKLLAGLGLGLRVERVRAVSSPRFTRARRRSKAPQADAKSRPR